MNLLEDLTKRFKGALGIKEELSKGDVNVDNLIKEARSLKAITEKVPQFEYEDMKDGGKLVCRVCDVSFKYSRNLESDFTPEKKLGLEFKNLKGTLRERLSSKRHEKAETELMSKELLQSKEERRNTAVGLRCGKLVYYLIKKGRPFDDYTTLIHLNAANGADMGELNHSHSFVLKFSPAWLMKSGGGGRPFFPSPWLLLALGNAAIIFKALYIGFTFTIDSGPQ